MYNYDKAKIITIKSVRQKCKTTKFVTAKRLKEKRQEIK